MNASSPRAEPPMAEPSTPSTPSSASTPAAVTPTRATGKAADAGAKRQDDDGKEDEWRHEPIAPVDEPNPLRSLGKAVSDIVLGDDATAGATPAAPKR